MRFKACHGRVGASPVSTPTLDPEAALAQGMAAFDRGHAIDAVAVLAPVAQRLRRQPTSEAFGRRFWQQYAFILGEAAARVDTRHAADDAAPASGAIDARTPVMKRSHLRTRMSSST